MKRTLVFALAALAISSSALADDIDFLPNGFVSSVMREARADRERISQTEKSRAQVRAETQEAARLGLLNTTEAGGKQPTSRQARQIDEAGQRALAVESVSR